MEEIQERAAALRLEVAALRYRLFGQVLTRAERQRLYEEFTKVYEKLERFEKYLQMKLRS